MKLLLLVCSMFLLQISSATIYYFSSTSGDDARTSLQAQNMNTPWRSIARLNSIFASLRAGDQVLFKRGDTFYGTILITGSGGASPIIISSYGAGAVPEITGFVQLSNWVSVGGGVWECSAPELGATVNHVTINDVSRPMGRYPNSDAANKGYLTYESFAGNTQIVDNELNSAQNWTGAEVVIRKVRGVIDRNIINNHSGSYINYNPGSSYNGSSNFGYFIQNHIRTLDQFGEWYYNPGTKKLSVFFGSASPSSYTIRASSLTNVISLNSQNNVLIQDLRVTGSNADGIRINGAQNITLRNLAIVFSGESGIKSSYTSNFIVDGNVISWSNNNGIDLAYNNDYAIVRNNKIDNTSTYAGMGTSGDGNSTGINSRGVGNLVEYNEVINTGYNGISFTDNNATIKNNYINNYCLIKDDGGGIYTFIGNINLTYSGRKVIGNIVLNGIGSGAGTSDPNYLPVNGIFLDDNSSGVEITGNTIANNANFGIFFHNAHDNILRDNTFFNNKSQLYMRSYEAPYGNVNNNEITGNIFYSKTATQPTSHLVSIRNDIGQFGRFDNNYYYRPFEENLPILNDLIFNNGNNTASEAHDLSTWQTKYNQDWNSKKAPYKASPFIISNQATQNKVQNGLFDAGIGYVNCWSPTNNCNTSWNSGGKLDGGAIQIGFTAPSNNNNVATTSLAVGSINSGKSYILKFSSVGAINGKSFAVYLRDNDQYNKLAPARFIKVVSSRTENEIIFSTPISANNAGLIFEFTDQFNTVWLDNVTLVEADVTAANPDNFIRFETNPSKTARSVSLDGVYTDVNNVNVSAGLTLPPYSSAILFRSSTTAKSSQTISFSAIPEKTAGIQPFDLIATASSGLPVAFRVISGPATLASNKITITGTGSVSIEASQAGNTAFHAAAPVIQNFQVVSAPAPVSCAQAGSVMREQWNNISGWSIASIPLQTTPTSTRSLSSLESQDAGELYGARVRGYICPPQSGNYTFWVSGDDVLELWLSSDENPSSRIRIATSNYTMFREWNKYPSQRSAPITLQTGNRYYIEVIQKEGGGGGHMSVGWTLPSGVFQAPIPGDRLIPFGQSGGSTQAPNIITFPAITDKVLGVQPFNISATASSNLAVSFKILSGPATIAGTSVSITGAGAVTIEATQAGDATYAAASVVTRTFNVTAASGGNCTATGSILREQWNNISGWAIGSIPLQTTPASTQMLTSFESQDAGQLYGARIRGYICPPQSGAYTFWISGDDVLELWLSADDNPAGRTKIATTNYTMFREFNKYPSQRSATINLQSGRRYYVEVLQKEGGGGGHSSVGWTLPNNVFQAPIPGSSLIPYSSGTTTLSAGTALARTDLTPESITLLNSYPNPLRTEAKLEVRIAESGPVTIQLFDVYGKMVASIYRGELESNVTRTFTIRGYQLPGGTYYVRLVTKSQVLSKSITVLR